ncbi:hypothetical protein ACFLSE_07600 [Bacteroidota bacterium]
MKATYLPIKTFILKGLLVLIAFILSCSTPALSQCDYPPALNIQNETIGQPGEYICYKAKETININNVTVTEGAKVIFQAPEIVVSPTSVLCKTTHLVGTDPCTDFRYPDEITTSRKLVCAGGNDGSHISTLEVSGNPSAQWVWYKNDLGDGALPDLGNSIGNGPSIDIEPLHKTDYFVRDESSGNGEFANIRIEVPVVILYNEDPATLETGKAKIEDVQENSFKITCNAGYHLSSQSTPYIINLDTITGGFIRKITGVLSSSGGTITILETEPATIADVFIALQEPSFEEYISLEGFKPQEDIGGLFESLETSPLINENGEKEIDLETGTGEKLKFTYNLQLGGILDPEQGGGMKVSWTEEFLSLSCQIAQMTYKVSGDLSLIVPDKRLNINFINESIPIFSVPIAYHVYDLGKIKVAIGAKLGIYLDLNGNIDINMKDQEIMLCSLNVVGKTSPLVGPEWSLLGSFKLEMPQGIQESSFDVLDFDKVEKAAIQFTPSINPEISFGFGEYEGGSIDSIKLKSKIAWFSFPLYLNFNAALNISTLDWNASLSGGYYITAGLDLNPLKIPLKKTWSETIVNSMIWEAPFRVYPDPDYSLPTSICLGEQTSETFHVEVEDYWYQEAPWEILVPTNQFIPFVNVYFSAQSDGTVTPDKDVTDIDGHAETEWVFPTATGNKWVEAVIRDANGDDIDESRYNQLQIHSVPGAVSVSGGTDTVT